MTTVAQPRPATPRPKLPSHGPAELDADHSDRNGAVDKLNVPRRPARPATTDPLSDRTTEALIRRTLCPQKLGDKGRDAQRPIQELLPPLTSRNDVDLQLYAFLAIVLRDFVQSWYSKITADETFVEETIHIVAHCTTALEQRLRKLDLESLVLDEIPDVLEKHVTAYRTAHRPVTLPPLKVNPREVYHSLHPLPFLSPIPNTEQPSPVTEQLENEKAYRQLLVQAALAVLLPTEDLENPCLTALVGQIFSELIIGNVIGNKASQPWLLLEGICIAARILGEKKADAAKRIVSGAPGLSRSDLAAKNTRGWSIHGFFLWLIQSVMIAIQIMRLIFTTISMSTSLPPRSSSINFKGEAVTGHGSARKPDSALPTTTPTKSPILAFSVWPCLGTVMEMPARMPWLHGCLSLFQHALVRGPGQIAGLNGALDRLLSYHIHNLLFVPSNLAPLLRSLRGAIFPNNAPGTPTLFPPPSDVELRALRRRAANAIMGLLPAGAGRIYLGGRLIRGADSDGRDEQMMLEQIEGILMMFSDEYCNKHLMYSVLELLLVRLMPELRHKGVEELLEDRLG